MPLIYYAFVLIIPALVALGLIWGGVWTWATPVFVYLLVPLVELNWQGSTNNLPAETEPARAKSLIANGLLFSLLPIQLFLLTLLFWRLETFSLLELLGATIGVGTMVGAIAINGAHELGHHASRWAKIQARLMLALSLYPHFNTEHNKGHHIRMATPEDPATAPAGQWVYAFWVQSIWGGFKSAWALERKRLNRIKQNHWSARNGMLQDGVAVLAIVAITGWLAGTPAVAALMATSAIGILLLETVNYLQHYGLQRRPNENGGYERVGPAHSWTSNRPLSRTLLFDLTRHADHHMDDRRHYTSLRHLEESPVLPQGYPAMILMALVPPLFLSVMDRQLAQFQGQNPQSGTLSP